VEVDRLVVASPSSLDDEALRSFARRALGPHGETVSVTALARADGRAVRLAMGAVRWACGQPGADWRLAVCLGLGRDGSSVALCLARGSGR